MAARMVLRRYPVISKLDMREISVLSRKLSAAKYDKTSVRQNVHAAAQYPEIKPRYPPGRWKPLEESLAWEEYEKSQEIASIPNSKERLEKIAGTENKIQYKLDPLHRAPGTLSYKQYLTKTHLFNHLPEVYSDKLNISDDKFQIIKSSVISAILQHEKYQLIQEGDLTKESVRYGKAKYLVRAILDSIHPLLIPELPQVLRWQFDEDVRVESFVRREGFKEDDVKCFGVNPKKGWMTFQANYVATHQIRTEDPLTPFFPLDDDICKGEYPKDVYSPMVMGFPRFKGRPITVSGHWIGDPCEWSVLGVNVMPPIYDEFVKFHGSDLGQKEMVTYGLVASFASAAAQAHNQGFNMYHDLTYPVCTQSVMTDGKYFRFMAYQLNTLQLWKPDEAVPLRNLAWTSPSLTLYEGIQGDTVEGFNDKVLSLLLHCLLRETVKSGLVTRPNLPEEPAPKDKSLYINHIGEEPLPQPVIGRFQYPRNSVYF